jgi:hypothetical protein
VRDYVGPVGRKGAEVRREFTGAGYGWPQDAVDAALMVLLTAGFLSARQNGQGKTAKQIPQSQIGVTEFRTEGITISAGQRLAMRRLLQEVGLPCEPGEEAGKIPLLLQRLVDLANEAGGEPPLPEKPSALKLESLRMTEGNGQFEAVYNAREELLGEFTQWTVLKEKKALRLPPWQSLQRLLKHAAGLPVAATAGAQTTAIRNGRSLLTEPDPVPPLTTEVADALRAALGAALARWKETYEAGLAGLAATTAWQKIDEKQRAEILAAHGLQALPAIHVGSVSDLLSTLDASPLANWENKIAALPPQIEQAHLDAARLLAPQAVRLQIPAATLHSAEEADVYLKDLRQRIMTYIGDGKPVIL